jgi:hypothetical protein
VSAAPEEKQGNKKTKKRQKFIGPALAAWFSLALSLGFLCVLCVLCGERLLSLAPSHLTALILGKV